MGTAKRVKMPGGDAGAARDGTRNRRRQRCQRQCCRRRRHSAIASRHPSFHVACCVGPVLINSVFHRSRGNFAWCCWINSVSPAMSHRLAGSGSIAAATMSSSCLDVAGSRGNSRWTVSWLHHHTNNCPETSCECADNHPVATTQNCVRGSPENERTPANVT